MLKSPGLPLTISCLLLFLLVGLGGPCWAAADKFAPEYEMLQDPDLVQWQFGERTSMAWDSGTPVIVAENRTKESSFAITAVNIPQGTANILVEGDVRVDGVEKGANDWEKARIHLTFHDSDGNQLGGWPEVGFWMGTSDWKRVSKTFQVPKGAVSLRINAGLQNASGKVGYKGIRAYALDVKRIPIQPLSRRVSNDTVVWYPWTQGVKAGGFSGSLADIGWILDKPAGKHGFVKVQGDHLAFEDGTRARFMGVDLVAGTCFPDRDRAKVLSSRLASMGVNIVRLHHMDADWAQPNIFGNGGSTLTLDPSSMDRLDYLISQLKAKGIYVFMDLLVHRVFKDSDGVADPVEAGAKVTGQFDTKLIELEKGYAKALMTHRNPYTKLKYSEEPAIAMMDIINESSMFWVLDIPEPYRLELKAKWNRWLTANYATRETLQAEWSKDPKSAASLGENEDPVKGTVEPSGMQAKQDARRADYLRFLYEKQNGYYLEMQAYLRGLGVKIPITGSNHWERSALDVASNARMDFIDQHGYWDHPQGGYGSDVTFSDRKMVKELGGLVSGLATKRVQGKPYTVTEWQNAWPNEYRAEGLLPVAAYASLQSWDALVQFEFASTDFGPTVDGNFDVGNKPELMAQWPLVALAFHRGDISPGIRPLVAYTDRKAMFNGTSVDDVMPAWAPLVDRVEHVLFADATKPVSLADAPGFADPTKQTAKSRTGQLQWDAKVGRVLVDTPLTKGVVGNAGKVSMDGMVLDIATPFSSLIATSMDGKRLSDSRRILLSAVARSENTGTVYSSARSRLLTPGTAPLLMEPVIGTVTLSLGAGRTDLSRISAYTLDANGKRKGKADAVVRDGLLVIELKTTDRSPWYEIVSEDSAK